MKFVIGDIHGELTKLKSLIKNIKKIDKNCELIFIGDYINKGENSKETLEYLITLNNITFLMGNHEYYIIEFIKRGKFKDKIIKYSKDTTFKDFNITFENIKEQVYLPYKSFFDNLKFFHETQKYFISHAGFDSRHSNIKLKDMPNEGFVLNNRYDFIKSNSLINGKVSIFGHTGFLFPYVDNVKIGIDTSAVYSKENPLTSFCLEDEFFLDNLNNKKYLVDFRKDICPIMIRKEPYRTEKI